LILHTSRQFFLPWIYIGADDAAGAVFCDACCKITGQSGDEHEGNFLVRHISVCCTIFCLQNSPGGNGLNVLQLLDDAGWSTIKRASYACRFVGRVV